MERLDIDGDARRALAALRSGGVVILPHSCGYGMFGGDADAARRIFSTKQRGSHKRNTMLCDMDTQREVHRLGRRRQDMIEAIAVDYDLPLGAIAPFHADHPLLRGLGDDFLRGSTAQGTINLYCNPGPFPNALCALAREAGQAIFGSSANLTGSGQKFRVEEIQPEVRAIADLVVDHGLCRYHSYRRSATIINFAALEVVRIGCCYEQIADILKRHFDFDIPADPGLDRNPSGHLQEFALSNLETSAA